MGFRNMQETQFGLVLNLVTDSISSQYNGVYDDMFSTVGNNTFTYI